MTLKAFGMKKIILTGGGTAGHVTPNIAIIPELKRMGYDILYVGSKNGIEKELIEKEGIPYKGIESGKLRRYIDIKNLTDPFRIIKGYGEARAICRKYKPDIVFSKGGYVSVPMVLAAAFQRIPVISHESDMTPGLANRITMPQASKICCNFPETLKLLPEGKGVLSGSPIRKEILSGSREEGLKAAGFDGTKPVLLVIGGSLGAVHVNTAVRNVLPKLLEKYDVIHICGRNNIDESLKGTRGYKQYGYVSEQLKDLFAAADIFISRAGANAICEILALHKPNLLIPLGAEASRGDQILNAGSFEKQGYSMVLTEDKLNDESLLYALESLWNDREKYTETMKASQQNDGVRIVTELIEETLNSNKKKKNEHHKGNQSML